MVHTLVLTSVLKQVHVLCKQMMIGCDKVIKVSQMSDPNFEYKIQYHTHYSALCHNLTSVHSLIQQVQRVAFHLDCLCSKPSKTLTFLIFLAIQCAQNHMLLFGQAMLITSSLCDCTETSNLVVFGNVLVRIFWRALIQI